MGNLMNAIRTVIARNSIFPHNVREQRPSNSQPNTFARPLTSPTLEISRLSFYTGRIVFHWP